jgi:type I restriction enzyme S subunit
LIGQAELSELVLPNDLFPATWSTCTIRQAGDSSLGQTKSKPQAPGERLPYLRVANVQDATLDLTDIAEMPFIEPERYVLHPGDVLLCDGQSLELVGRAAMYTGTPERILFQNHLIRFRPYAGISPEYALAVFRAYQKTGVFSAIAKATTNIANISLTRFRELPFPLAPPSVQSEITSNLTAVQDNLDLISDVIANSLRELEDVIRSARDEEILGTDAASWVGGQTGRSPWPIESAAEVVSEQAPIVYGIVQPGPNVEEGVPYIRGLDLQEGHIESEQLWRTTPEIASRYERSALQAGDVLLNIIRHTRVAAVPASLIGANITRTTARLRPGAKVSSPYLSHWLSSGLAQRWLATRMRGIDMPGLNLRDVRLLPVPVPPLDSQNEICVRLDEVVTRAEILRASFRRLEKVLPDLETDLIESFAYGASAAAISGRMPDEVQISLSRELLESLPTELTEPGIRSASPTQQAVEPLIGKDWDRVRPVRTGLRATKPDDVAEALAALGGRASPEDLYRSMKLSDLAVDSFYEALRELIKERRLREVRPNDSEVALQIVVGQ